MLNQFTASLWGDEAFSAVLSRNSIADILTIISKDTSPPLYNITEHLWFQLFGSGELVIRLLSFVYYLIASFFVYKFVTYFWDRRTAVVAVLLTFFNPFFFVYAFEGRMYSILALGVVASMYFFGKLMFPKRERSSIRQSLPTIIGYILATSWALYSHHFAIFAVIIQGVWLSFPLVKRNLTQTKQIILGFIGVAILYTPWLPSLYAQTKLVGTGFWLARPTLTNLGEIIQKYLATGNSNSLVYLAFGLIIVTLVARRWKDAPVKTIFVLTWFLGPILLAFIISQRYTSIFYDRYLLYTIPAGMILVATNTRKAISVVAISGCLAVFVYVDYLYFTHPTKLPFKELAAYLLETKRGDDFVINWNSAAHHLWESKYYQINAPLYIPQGGELPFYVGTAQMTKDDVIRSLPPKACRVGVITSGSVDEVIIPEYKPSETKIFGNLKFIWFSK